MPLPTIGMMCSMANKSVVKSRGERQYSQYLLALSMTVSLIFSDTLAITNTQVLHDGVEVHPSDFCQVN